MWVGQDATMSIAVARAGQRALTCFIRLIGPCEERPIGTTGRATRDGEELAEDLELVSHPWLEVKLGKGKRTEKEAGGKVEQALYTDSPDQPSPPPTVVVESSPGAIVFSAAAAAPVAAGAT